MSETGTNERTPDAEPGENEIGDPQPAHQASEDVGTDEIRKPDLPEYGEDDSQDYVDRSVIDFDPADGLYAGTAVDGTSEIPEVSKQEIEEEKERQGLDEDDASTAGSSAGSPGSSAGGGAAGAGAPDADAAADEHPKPYPHDGKGPDS